MTEDKEPTLSRAKGQEAYPEQGEGAKDNGKAENPRSAIVFDGRYIQDRYHGIGRYAFHMVVELAAALPSQQLTVLRDPSLAESRFDWTKLEATPNVRLKEVAAPPFGLAEQIRLPRLLARNKWLYHTPYFALPWLLTAYSMVTVHDCIFERDARYMPKRWARSYYRLLMTVSLRRAHAVFVPSRATAADVRWFYRVPARKLIVTPEAADSAFQPIQNRARLEEVRERYALQRPFMLAVGARRPHKNFGLLVRAFAQVGALSSASAAPQLVFVGDADERFSDEAATVARSLGDKVRFLGKVPEADLPALYNLADAFACPSLIEGFGLPVLEAMSCGTPVICSDIPVLREVAGDAALRVPPTDIQAWGRTLQRIFSEAELRESLSRAGLERSTRFTWQRCASAALPVYKKLLS